MGHVRFWQRRLLVQNAVTQNNPDLDGLGCHCLAERTYGVHPVCAPFGFRYCLFHKEAVQERHHLATGADDIRRKPVVANTVRDPVFHRPGHSLGVVGVGRDIREAARALGLGAADSTPQEGDDLRAGAGLVRSKQVIANAAGDALLRGPLHGFVVVGVGHHIGERAGLGLLGKAGLDLYLARRHGEGVLAVALVGEL